MPGTLRLKNDSYYLCFIVTTVIMVLFFLNDNGIASLL